MRKILAILAIALLYSCDNTPNDVLSKSKMEDILFDYHLAQSMIYDLSREDQENKSQEYIDAVFRKHGITQEQFDSSLVWYNRNSKEYHKIYENLKIRFDKKNNDLQLQNGNNDMMAVFSNGGDTTNIWGAKKLMILRNNNLLNKESFTFKADTSFHKSDCYILMCKASMLLESNNERSEYIAIGLSVVYKDGTSIGRSKQVSRNENVQITVEANDSMDIAKVSGFFYFNGNPNYRSAAIIDDIQLIRMHEQAVAQEPEKPDTTLLKTEEQKPETIHIDTTHERISPEDLLKNNMRERKIDIKAAPDVRTPNSFGRRKAAPARARIQ